jgi:hypothetical protein
LVRAKEKLRRRRLSPKVKWPGLTSDIAAFRREKEMRQNGPCGLSRTLVPNHHLAREESGVVAYFDELGIGEFPTQGAFRRKMSL